MDTIIIQQSHVVSVQLHYKQCVLTVSLDQVLECVSVSPLLGVRRSVSDGGEMTKTQAVLHALLAARLLLLCALCTKPDKDK